MAKKSTTKNKTKKYNYVTKTLTLPDGSRKYVYGKTKAEAEEKLADLKAQIAAGVDINDDTTFGELAKLWFDKYKAPTVKASSLSTIKSLVNSRVMPRLALLRVKDITSLVIQDLFADMVNDDYGPTGNALSYLREIFNLAVDLGCIAKSPVPSTMKAPKRAKKEKDIVPLAVEEGLLKAFLPLTNERLFFLCGRQMGFRRGETYALNWDVIDLENDVIHVRRGLVNIGQGKTKIVNYTKTEHGLRDVPIPPTLKEELLMWLNWYGTNKNARSKNSGGYLFTMDDGSPYTSKAVDVLWNHIRDAAREIDPKYAEDFTSHALRRTYITRLFEAGLDIKEIQTLAGHKDVATTLGIYVKYDRATRQDATFAKVREALSGTMKPNPATVISFPNVVNYNPASEG